jgi:hypothetical protein
MTVSVLPLGEDEKGEASDNPMPEPSAIMIAVTAMAVSAPAITPLQDTPLQFAPSRGPASTTVAVSRKYVVSAIGNFSRKNL